MHKLFLLGSYLMYVISSWNIFPCPKSTFNKLLPLERGAVLQFELENGAKYSFYGIHFVLVQVFVEPGTISMCYLSRVSWLFPCSSRSS